MLELPKIEELPSYKETYKRGLKEGVERGVEKGIEKGIETAILIMHKNGRSVEHITADLSITVEEIIAVIGKGAKR